MRYEFYGKTNEYGMEIDHIFSATERGFDDLNNLQPLQWNNNYTKGDYFPKFPTYIYTLENKNIESNKSWIYEK